MPDIILATDWRVDLRQRAEVRQLRDLVTRLAGDFRIVPQIEFHEETAFIDRLVVKVAAEQRDDFLSAAGQMGLRDWNDLPDGELFSHDLAFDPYTMRPYDQRTWEARVSMAHYHNQRVAQRDHLIG